MIIYKYYHDQSGISDNIPYNGEQKINGVEFDCLNIPDDVIALIADYLDRK